MQTLILNLILQINLQRYKRLLSKAHDPDALTWELKVPVERVEILHTNSNPSPLSSFALGVQVNGLKGQMESDHVGVNFSTSSVYRSYMTLQK